MDDGAGDAGELPVEIGNDAIHPALLARVLGVSGETGPVLNPVETDQRRKVRTIGFSPESI